MKFLYLMNVLFYDENFIELMKQNQKLSMNDSIGINNDQNNILFQLIIFKRFM